MTDASGQSTDARVQITDLTYFVPIPCTLSLAPYTFNHLLLRIKSKQSKIRNLKSAIKDPVTRNPQLTILV